MFSILVPISATYLCVWPIRNMIQEANLDNVCLLIFLGAQQMLVRRFSFSSWRQISFEVNASGEGLPSPQSPHQDSGRSSSSWKNPSQDCLCLKQAALLSYLLSGLCRSTKARLRSAHLWRGRPSSGAPHFLALVGPFSAASTSLFTFSFCPDLLPSSHTSYSRHSLHPIGLVHKAQCAFQEPALRYFSLNRREIYWPCSQV